MNTEVEAQRNFSRNGCFSFFQLLLNKRIRRRREILLFQFLSVVTIEKKVKEADLKVLVSFSCYIQMALGDELAATFQFLSVVTRGTGHPSLSCIRSFSFFQLLHKRGIPDELVQQVLVSFSCYALRSMQPTSSPDRSIRVLVSFSCYNICGYLNCPGLRQFQFLSVVTDVRRYQEFMTVVLVSFSCYRIASALDFGLNEVLVSFSCYTFPHPYPR